MRRSCEYDGSMPSLQIRNMPADLHRRLKARAALSGQSLSDFSLAVLARSLERPTQEEFLAGLADRGPVGGDIDAAALVRAERDSR